MLPEFFREIGSDRHLMLAETPSYVGAGLNRPAADEAWILYQRDFDGFCETGLDPQFHRLSHPTSMVGGIHLRPEEPVLVVGTGPSLEARVATVARMRNHLRIFTSTRGAEALARYNIRPDLVLVEHRTALDAHHSARHVRDIASSGADLHGPRSDYIRGASLVATDWRTPSSLVAGVAPDRLFVPDALPTWGAWPATLAAMAIAAGSGHVGLLGIDLGDAERPDPTFAPLASLLSLLAGTPGVSTIDCGAGGAIKDGWSPDTVEELAASRPMRPLARELRRAPSIDKRRADAIAMLLFLGEAIDTARDALRLARRARGGVADLPALREVAGQMLSWGGDAQVRVGIQETLGASFLPRLWRTGMRPEALGPAVWRPVMLAAHEVVTQADRLSVAVRDIAA